MSAATTTANDIISLLNLKPHPEGGYYTETYRAPDGIARTSLHERYGADRHFSSAIYYLLTPDSVSTFHRLASDEVFHFYAGDPVEQVVLRPTLDGEVVTLGNDLAAGQRPQVVVPLGVWQGARLCAGGKWALLGCTVAPGFDFADFEVGERAFLLEMYGDPWRAWIDALTKA
jgi:predicted cupin superfamily sugar epimerase